MMRGRVFTAPNGVQRKLWFRDETNDESTLIATFEEDEYKLLERYKGGAIIDLGAHIGGVTMLASTLSSAPKIIAVEPLPENCELLSESADSNDINIILYEKAITPVPSSDILMYYGKDVHEFVGQENLTASKEYADERDCVTVGTVTLKEIFDDNKIEECGFLKIDIEGAEEDIFKTLPRELLKRIRVIAGEYHNKDREGFFPFGDDFNIHWDKQEFFFERK